MSLPAHSISKEYPFILPPVSFEGYAPEKRLGEIIHVKDSVINMDKEKVDKLLEIDKPENYDAAFVVGIVNRLITAEHSLLEAENQVVDLMKDMPFEPERFCFDKASVPTTIEDAPIFIYQSKLDPSLLLTRVIGSNNDWIMKKGETKTLLYFPCERVAYHTFIGMKIPIVMESQTDILV